MDSFWLSSYGQSEVQVLAQVQLTLSHIAHQVSVKIPQALLLFQGKSLFAKTLRYCLTNKLGLQL